MRRTIIAWFLWTCACFGNLMPQLATVRQDTAHTLLANLALHDWALEYREFHTEFLQCLYGVVRGDTVVVLYGVMADVKPSHSLATTVIPQPDGQCATTGDSLVGIAHNHPQSCRGGNGAACGLLTADSASMHPQDDPGNDPCFESWPDIRTFVASKLDVNVVVCGVGKMYIQRRGGVPNQREDICTYNPEDDVPTLKCGNP